MDHKELVTRFTKACYRFEAIQGDLDILLFDTDNEIKANEYEDLANQAAEIILKLSANGNNVGEHFYRYYVERLEYIIDYFRPLLDYGETPLAEDEQDELDDEPGAEVRFEDFPAGCAFPKKPDFVLKKWGFKFTPTAKDEANAAADEPDAEEEDDQTVESDEAAGDTAAADKIGKVAAKLAALFAAAPPAELDDENDAQAAESNETADDTGAGAPISEEDILQLPDVVPITENVTRCWGELSSKECAAVRETFAMWGEMNDITGRNSGGGDYAEAVKELDNAERWFTHAQSLLIEGYPRSLVNSESTLRERINMAIVSIPGFQDSEKFKELIERYPTYKEELQ